MIVWQADLEWYVKGQYTLQNEGVFLDKLYSHYWFNPGLALLRHREAVLVKHEIDNLNPLLWPTLDVGSWNGLFAGTLWLNFDIGLEPSVQQSQRSLGSWNYKRVIQGDLSDLDSDEFWFVLVNSVIEHVQDVDVFLDQLFRVMKKWWEALVTIPLVDSINTVHEKVLWDGRFRALTKFFLGHHNMLSVKEWVNVFQTSWFSVQKCLPYLSEMLGNYISANAYFNLNINVKLAAEMSPEMLNILKKTLSLSHFLLNTSLIQSLEQEDWKKTCVLFKLRK